jgi:hypothetical protein
VGECWCCVSTTPIRRGRAFEEEGAVRFDTERRPTLLRPDGSATYHLASVVDDLDFAITHVIRGKDHLSNTPLHEALARARRRAARVRPARLILGEDGQKLSKQSGLSTLAALREAGIPPEAVRAYSSELGLLRGDVRFDATRLRRLAARVGVAVELAPMLRGARDLNEARSFAECVLEPLSVELPPGAASTPERFSELRAGLAERIEVETARSLVQELRASGGDRRGARPRRGAQTRRGCPRALNVRRRRRQTVALRTTVYTLVLS